MPWWTTASSGAAPILLVGGFTVAAARQPPGYDPVRDTISALAARGATDRWVMTAALAGLGFSYLATAAGLRPGRTAGRVVLAAGGLATVGVATFPQPAHGNSVAHTIAATLAFGALALWPALAAGRSGPRLLAPAASATAVIVMVGLVLWFVAEIHGGQRGLAERVAAGAEALWPLAVVLSSRRPDPEEDGPRSVRG